ncbi:ral guanine nucleotide dissociation stimulator-like [Cynocephalus volans]
MSPDATHRVWRLPAGTLKKRLKHLVPAALAGNCSYVHMFLLSYRDFTSPLQMVHLLFLRYGRMVHDCHGDGESLEQLKCAMSSILKIWLDFYSVDFYEPPAFYCLKSLLAYIHINMLGSEVERKADLLLANLKKLEHLEPSEAETEVPVSAQAEQQSQDLLPRSAPAPAPAPPPLPEPEPEPEEELDPEAEQDPEPKPEPEHDEDPELESEHFPFAPKVAYTNTKLICTIQFATCTSDSSPESLR